MGALIVAMVGCCGGGNNGAMRNAPGPKGHVSTSARQGYDAVPAILSAMNINTDGLLLVAIAVGSVMALGLLARFLIWVNRKRDGTKTKDVRALATKEIPSAKDLDDFEDRYGRFAVPAIGLEVKATDEEKESTGRSRIGGRPDLPEDLVWPMTKDGAPMSFLAQFDLQRADAVLRNNGLPREGHLCFFSQCDNSELSWGDRGVESAVYWFDDAVSLSRRDHPEELAKSLRYAPCAVAMSEKRTYPDPAVLSALGKVDGNDDIHDEDRAITLLNRGSHLSGCPMPMHGPVEFRTQRIHMEKSVNAPSVEQTIEQEEAQEQEAAREWALLFQLCSESEAGMGFYEQDHLYFMIRRSDLAARNFSRVICHMCSSGPDHWIKLTDAHPRRGR